MSKNNKTKTEIISYISKVTQPEDYYQGTDYYTSMTGKQVDKKYIYVSIPYRCVDLMREFKQYGFKIFVKKYTRYGLRHLSYRTGFPYMELRMEYVTD